MPLIEELIKERNDQFLIKTKEILNVYKDKLNKILSIQLNKEVQVDWQYINVIENEMIHIHGYISMNIGDTIIDNSVKIEITEANINEYIQYTKLTLSIKQLNFSTPEEIINDMEQSFFSPEKLNKTDFENIRDSKKLTEEHTKLLNYNNISTLKH